MKVFLSYRRDDLGGHCAALVGRIYDRLSAQYGGENVFMDLDTIPPGADFAAYLGEAVERADVLLAVVGPDWVSLMQQRAEETSDFVRVEVESALQKSIPVVPLLIGGASMPKDLDLPDSLKPFAKRNAFPVDSGRDFNSHVTRLIADLERHYGSQGAREEDKRVTPREEATAPVISVSKDDAEEELKDEFQPAVGSGFKEVVQSIHKIKALSQEGELHFAEEKGVPVPKPERARAAKRVASRRWLVGLGTMVVAGIFLGGWQPWKTGGGSGKSIVPEKGGMGRATGKVNGKNFTNSLGIEMLWCPPGTFTMGSPIGERVNPLEVGEEQFEVTLTKGFWIAKTEVTQEQWTKLMGSNPSSFSSSGSQAPVDSVSWEEAMEFCRKLTEEEQSAGNLSSEEEYTLPTEAQWEYACRAGTNGPFNMEGVNLVDLGWYEVNSAGWTHSVGQKVPNAWGLYDMHGNVREWCLDWFDDYPDKPATDPAGPAKGNSRVFRGGSWNCDAEECRSASRPGLLSLPIDRDTGFRLVRASL